MTRRHQVLLALMLAMGHGVPAFAATRCEDLTALSTQTSTVTSARTIAAGVFSAGGRGGAQQQALYARLPAFCQVQITLRPSADSDIKVEVWLPASTWNGKLQAVGAGGLAGSIPHALMAPSLAAGYATAATDTGHVGDNADFMPEHPEKLVDFAYRATHEMAVAAKRVIDAHYGKPPAFSYYNGCSGGGRHALTSAQRYPTDFDGIVAGAPSWNQARLDAVRIGINLAVNRTPESRIPESKYPMIHKAVLNACDALDGASDGVLADPRQCQFDYASLKCPGADNDSCLTAAQVESAKALTSPFKDPLSGAVLYEAHLLPGTELEWARLGGPEPPINSVDRVRRFHLKDPNWQFRLENIAADVERATKMDGGLLASNNFNLKPFFDRGGKLLIWHGWDDPQVPAQNSIMFYENVLKTVGPDARKSMELLLLPGVLHCGGGPGADTFDRMGFIEQWVETGARPARIVASRVTKGTVERTRPVCPFGQVATYNGSGSLDAAASFRCTAEASTVR